MNEAHSFDDFYSSKAYYFGRAPFQRMDEFLNLWQRDVHGNALDLGCGEGRDAIHLARRGYSVEAVDISSVGT